MKQFVTLTIAEREGTFDEARTYYLTTGSVNSRSAIQESTFEQCFELGAKTILHKPPKQDVLHNTITEVLGLREEAAP